MIDEDLYQQATDELNSDRRRPHIWARACALASDDHDEARYLYTNLRVEELIAEREAEKNAPARNPAEIETDSTLALESLDFDDDKDSDLDDNFADLAQQDVDIPSSVPAPSGKDRIDDTRDDVLKLVPIDEELSSDDEAPISSERKVFEEEFDKVETSTYDSQLADLPVSEEDLDSTINLTSELDGTAVFEFDEGHPDDANDQTGAAQSEDTFTDDLDSLLGGVYEAPAQSEERQPLNFNDPDTAVTGQFSDMTDATQGRPGEMDWLHAEMAERVSEDLHTIGPDETLDRTYDETDILAQELERQADELLPGMHSDVVSFNDGPGEPSTAAETDGEPGSMADDGPGRVRGDYLDLDSDEQFGAGTADVSGTGTIERETGEFETGVFEPADFDSAADQQDYPSANEDDNIAAQDDLAHDQGKDDRQSGSAAGAAASAGAAAGAAVAVGAAAGAGVAHESDTIAVAARSASGETEEDLFNSHDYTSEADARSYPIDLSETTMGALFAVYRRGNQAQAVKDGVSWSALFLTLPYLIYRHLFGTAIVYGLLWIIVLTGLLVSGLAWVDASTAATPIVKFSTVGFGLLAILGLVYLPFRYGNLWREDKLEQRGYELVAWVRASSPGKALSEARRAAALD